MRVPRIVGAASLIAGCVAPAVTHGCACGCGVFDVATSSMFPQGTGGMMFIEYNYQDQTHDWSGDSEAPAANNDDKEIRTHFVTLGLQYMFNNNWGLQVEVPYVNRYFKTEGGSSGSDIVSLNWGDMGDMRIKGIYTGFSDDQSTGINFGLKLPTGNYTYNDAYDDVDRDSEIGTGSTDLLLGGFHHHELAGAFDWFGQVQLDLPVFSRDEYRPGLEVDAAAGVYYRGLSLGRVDITPIAQVIGSERTRDTGANSANPVASGYQRLLLSPGLELDMHPLRLYADVEFPVFEHVTGNQLVAPALFKLSLSYMF